MLSKEIGKKCNYIYLIIDVIQFLARAKDTSPYQRMQNALGPTKTPFQGVLTTLSSGRKGQGMRLITYLYQLLRFRMHRGVPSLSHTRSDQKGFETW
jgi:hypothetical protein